MHLQSLIYPQVHLSLHLSNLKICLSHPSFPISPISLQFHYWIKREIFYLLISGAIEPEEVQFSHHADRWNWSHYQGSVVKSSVDDLPSPFSAWSHVHFEQNYQVSDA